MIFRVTGCAASNMAWRTSGASAMTSTRLPSRAALNASSDQSSNIFAPLRLSSLPVSRSKAAFCDGVSAA
jgi:hypothetical protein